MTASSEDWTARNEIVRIGTSLFARGYVHASAGNIGARTDGGFVATETDAALGFLEPGKLAVLGPEGEHLAGGRPTKAARLHRAILDADRTAGFVIHTHSTHLVACSLQNAGERADLIPPLTPYFVMKVGHVPQIPYHRPGDPEVALAVTRLIDERPGLRAVMLERLGPVVWGPDAGSAMATLEELEETARLWLLTGGRPSPLPAQAIAELRETFGAVW